MFQYYRDMWPRRSHVLSPLTEAASVPKGRKILWNDTFEDLVKEIKHMVSDETLSSYPDCTIPSTVHTEDYYEQVCAVIGHNNKPITLL